MKKITPTLAAFTLLGFALTGCGSQQDRLTPGEITAPSVSATATAAPEATVTAIDEDFEGGPAVAPEKFEVPKEVEEAYGDNVKTLRTSAFEIIAFVDNQRAFQKVTSDDEMAAMEDAWVNAVDKKMSREVRDGLWDQLTSEEGTLVMPVYDGDTAEMTLNGATYTLDESVDQAWRINYSDPEIEDVDPKLDQVAFAMGSRYQVPVLDENGNEKAIEVALGRVFTFSPGPEGQPWQLVGLNLHENTPTSINVVERTEA